MKLPEDTRKALRRGEAVKHTFIQPVKRDGIYVIHTDNWTGQGHFRVIQVAPVLEGWLALICFEGDPVRIPNKDGGTGSAGGAYTNFAGRAMPRGDEPGPELEAVDEATQNAITKEAQTPNMELRRQRRLPEPEGLNREKRSLEARLGLARKVAEIRQVDISPHVRTIEKRLGVIERQLEAAETPEAA